MTFEIIKKILIKNYDEEEERIALETRLTDDLGIDYIYLTDLIFDIETVFDVVISEEKMEKLETIADIVNAVEAYRSRGSYYDEEERKQLEECVKELFE